MDFIQRARGLPSSSLLHIPVDQRERHALLLAGLLERIADGDEFACELEESRTKLLLGPVPQGLNRRVELAKRLRLWDDGELMTLLVRIEEQHRLRSRRVRAFGGSGSHTARARRARALVSEGAYSKATACLTSEVASLDEQQQRH